MAITVYSGLQGHGKTYEFVRSVIIPNVTAGRRIVTNVAGLNIEAIRMYCLKQGNCELEDLGEVIQVTNDDVIKPNFYPQEGKDTTDSIVKPGDIVGLDECWRWFAAGLHLDNAHMTFFRMHRHFVDPATGVACDVVLIVQAISDLQRKVLAVVEKSYKMRKHKDLGLSDRYIVSVFSGNRQVAGVLIESFQQSYNPDIFALYNSYSQSKTAVDAKEIQVDKRGNVFNRTLIKIGIPLSLIMIFFAFWYIWRFFHPKPKADQTPQVSEQITQEKSFGPPIETPAPLPLPKKPLEEGVSERWRLVGMVGNGVLVTFALEDQSRRIRFISNPPAYKQSPGELELKLPNGDITTRWSGSPVTFSGSARPRDAQSLSMGMPHE